MHASDQTIRIGQMEIRYLFEGKKTGGGMGVFELTVPPGARVPPPHSHADVDEYLRVLEGRLRHVIDGQTRDLAPGEGTFTLRGSVHHFSNPFDQTARALVVLTPDIDPGFFREVADLVNAGGPADPSKLVPIMARYGLTPAKAAA
jgi:quercetin dioxygenase-like cupin family protein